MITATHSTPAGVVVEYFESLRWLAESARRATDLAQARRIAAMATILAVTAVEVFLNLWFRVLVDDRNDAKLKARLVSDLDKPMSLDQKLTEWPVRHFNQAFDLVAGAGRAFIDLKAVRNGIVHFKTSHETIQASNVIIHGLANTTHYDALNAASAERALSVAEGVVAEVMRLAGFDEVTANHALAAWIGKVGSARLDDPTSHGVAPWIVPHVQR